MRHSSDIPDPVNTTARVEMWCDEETYLYYATVEGYQDSNDVTVLHVEPLYSDGKRRPLVTDEAAALVRMFWRVWENEDGEYRDERHDLLQQFKAAILNDTDECRYERARHANAEAICGHSI